MFSLCKIKRVSHVLTKTTLHLGYWYVRGKIHHINGPAATVYHDNGSLKLETWFNNGKLHRINGPAIIYYHDDGRIQRKSWCANDELIDDTILVKRKGRYCDKKMC